MKVEGWRMKLRGWRMKNEGWRMKDEGWRMKGVYRWKDKQTLVIVELLLRLKMLVSYLSAKDFPQWAQPYGLSPVWDLMWPCNSQGREKALPQTSHLWDKLWVRICMDKAGMLTYIWKYLSEQKIIVVKKNISYLITNRALFGIRWVQRSMCLSMSGKVATRGIIFTTFSTGVFWLGFF